MPTSTTSTAGAQALKNFQTQATNASNNFLSGYFANLGGLEFLSIIVSALLFALIVYVAMETGWARLRVDRFRHVILKSNISKQAAQKSWVTIQKHFYEGSENSLKVAVLDADKLLSEALREAGVMGTQLGDRLKNAKPEQVPNLDELWQAHKLRNQIAHESDFKLKRDLAERALTIYEAGLRNLGVFDSQGR